VGILKPIVFDTQALLALYLGEAGAEKTEEYLTLVLQKKVGGFMNVVNLAELYYILSRVSNTVAAEKERNLKSFGVQIVFDNATLWKHAASIKAEHLLSLADAFAAATAFRMKGILVTGADTEFDGIKGLQIDHIA
jgi:predicted nucleic acid-binding protein